MKYILIGFILLNLNSSAQVIKNLSKDTKTNIRGMSVVSDEVIWVCGSNGMVAKSFNGGKSWRWKRLPNFEKTDFRDIVALDENTALLMAVGEPGIILRTDDGGVKWKQVYVNTTPGIFLDVLGFWNEKLGIALGDPIKNKFIVARTYDGGITWHDVDHNSRPSSEEGEACFASSGTNMRTIDEQCFFVTGGKNANIYINGKPIPLPIIHGKPTQGANSLAIKGKNTFIVVGGDFDQPDAAIQNCCISKDGGLKWTVPQIPPGGYRSCIEYISKKSWITCGYNGVDISYDEGLNWSKISSDSYNVCKKAKKGNVVFLAGNNGLIAKFEEKK